MTPFFERFESDCCIEILNPAEFCSRIRRRLIWRPSTHRFGVLSRDIDYYDPSQPIAENVKDPKSIPFLKRQEFRPEKEFRITFGTRNAFELEQSIVLNEQFDIQKEAERGTFAEKFISIRSIKNISKIHFNR